MNKVLLIVGELKGSVDGVKSAQESLKKDLQAVNKDQWEKLESIEKTLNNTRVRVAGISAGVSFAIVFVGHFIKKFIASGGQGG